MLPNRRIPRRTWPSFSKTAHVAHVNSTTAFPKNWLGSEVDMDIFRIDSAFDCVRIFSNNCKERNQRDLLSNRCSESFIMYKLTTRLLTHFWNDLVLFYLWKFFIKMFWNKGQNKRNPYFSPIICKDYVQWKPERLAKDNKILISSCTLPTRIEWHV